MRRDRIHLLAFVRALADWKYEPATRGTAKVPYHTVLFAKLPG